MPGTLFLLAGNFRMQNAAIIISCLKMMVDANNVRMKQKWPQQNYSDFSC
jgi:hypothetical protein